MAGSPWPNSPYPPFPAQYAPAAPSFDPRRPQYGHPPPAGFYNPAVLAQQQQQQRLLQQQSEYRAYAPPPTMPTPHIPSVLTPGAGHRTPSYPALRSNSGDLPDLFFTAPSFPTPQLPSRVPPAPQLRQSISAPAPVSVPPVPRRPDPSQPPLPPKPTRTAPPGALPLSAPGPSRFPERTSSRPSGPMYSDAQPGPSRFPERTSSRPSAYSAPGSTYPELPQAPSSPPPMEEDDRAFRTALEQSARDAAAAKRREEEELARAMAESLSMASSSLSPPLASGSGSRQPHSAPATVHASPAVSAFVPEQASSAASYSSSPPTMAQQILDDEALARRLAEEDEDAGVPARDAPRPAPPEPQRKEQTWPAALPLAAPPPEYTPSPPASTLASPMPTTDTNLSRQPSPVPVSPPYADAQHIARRSSANAVQQASPPMHDADARAGRSQSFGASSAASSSSSLSTRPPLQHANSNRSQGSSPLLPAVPEAGARADEEGASPEPAPAPVLPPGNSQYVDSEMLRGVTIGFGPPTISAVLAPFEGPIPNVIALPYGRAPPLHLKAPSWRGLLKLMARLSNTRLEPTVEAMAVVKTTMHLRVVVNFVKVHQSSNDWHVILYMTIDHPVPDDHRYRSRNTNDPALLPYSYTLSPTPVFLREAADGPLSKWFAVPSTQNSPHPALPLAFPDLATYLMGALEDSRRAAADRSGGANRLAKAVDAFYPAQRGEQEEQEERRGIGERVRGLFGRGSRAMRPANDDRSDLVTPFYADDFGR